MLKPNCGADQGCWPNHGDLTGSGLDNGASSSIACTSGAIFVVYDGTYHTGASQTYELTSTCNNGLASNFNDRVSSVNGNGACVRLFQHSDCQGASIMLKPNCGADQGCWPNHGDLTGSGLDNGASSSIKC